jgi:hypothetical protein
VNKKVMTISFSVIIIGALLFWSVPKVSTFIKVDRCLDKGGVFDYKKNECDFVSTHLPTEEY